MKKHVALLAVVAGSLLLGAAPGARAGSWAFDRDRDARHHHRNHDRDADVRSAERHRAIVREEAREAERRREIARSEEARRERERHRRPERRHDRHDHNPLGYIGAADRDRHR